MTGVAIETLKEIGSKITAAPKDFHVHRTIQRFLENRRKAIETGEGIDWATGEALAFCSLLLDGHRVRLSGQDSERGTFSQRHSVLIDQMARPRLQPVAITCARRKRATRSSIRCCRTGCARLRDRLSLAEPSALTLWEAPSSRDFANGAQVVFDQFISSGERKWLRCPVSYLLLRMATRARGLNIPRRASNASCSSALKTTCRLRTARRRRIYFHILRRQLKRDIRKPLILMTPKSLLRHKRAVSRLDEMGPKTTFHRLLWDDAQMLPDEKVKLVPDDKIRRVVLCTGKVYYDLYEEREKRGINDIYLLRVEQLYPVPLRRWSRSWALQKS